MNFGISLCDGEIFRGIFGQESPVWFLTDLVRPVIFGANNRQYKAARKNQVFSSPVDQDDIGGKRKGNMVQTKIFQTAIYTNIEKKIEPGLEETRWKYCFSNSHGALRVSIKYYKKDYSTALYCCVYCTSVLQYLYAGPSIFDNGFPVKLRITEGRIQTAQHKKSSKPN